MTDEAESKCERHMGLSPQAGSYVSLTIPVTIGGGYSFRRLYMRKLLISDGSGTLVDAWNIPTTMGWWIL